MTALRKEDGNYKKFKKDKLFFRNRGLKELQERFDIDISKIITDTACNQKNVKILEIGFGEGRAILEACSINKNIYGYGINEKKKSTLSSSKDLIKNAKIFRLKPYNIPKVYFYDVGYGLKFSEKYFDIIFSQVAIHYVGDKIKLFEDIWRTLKVGGYAFLHIDGGLNAGQPEFMQYYKDTPRLVIYQGDKIVSTEKIFRKIQKQGFDIRLQTAKDKRKSTVLLMCKNNSKKLHFDLNYDGNSTIYLTPLKNTDSYKFDSAIWWGTRSIYR